MSELRARARTHVPGGAERATDPPGPPAAGAPERRRLGGRAAAGLAAAGLALIGVGAVLAGPTPWRGRPVAVAPAAGVPASPADWAAVLRELDRRRALAFSTSDAAALGEVYAPGSAALAADRDGLAALRAKGLHSNGLRVRLERVAVREAVSGRVELAVVDRLAGYALADRRGATRAEVPGRGPVTWQVRLVPAGNGGWVISEVTRASGEATVVP